MSCFYYYWTLLIQTNYKAVISGRLITDMSGIVEVLYAFVYTLHVIHFNGYAIIVYVILSCVFLLLACIFYKHR